MTLSSIDRSILRLTWPAIATNVTVPLLGLVDVAIVGHIGDARYIGAIAIGTMMFNVIFWLFAFLRMGTSGLTAQAYGAGDAAAWRSQLRKAVRMALVLSVALLVAQHGVYAALQALFDTPAAMQPLVDTYYRIGVWGIPAMLTLYSLTGWLIGMQNTRATMVIAISQNIINIGLSLFFVFALRMSIAGVALGTVMAQWAGMGIAVVWVRNRLNKPKAMKRATMAEARDGGMKSRRSSPDEGKGKGESVECPAVEAGRQNAATLFSTYFNIFLRTAFLVAVNLAFVAFGTSLGEETLAVNTLLMQLFMLYSYITDGFAYAGEALCGRYLGARQPMMLRLTVHRLFVWGTGVMLLFTVAYAVGALPFLHLLTSDTTVVEAAHPYLPWIMAVPAAGMAAFVWDGIYIGITRTRAMLLATALAAVAFFLLWHTLHNAWGNHALWLAFIAFLLVRGIVQTVAWRTISYASPHTACPNP